jgi:hypothetical protein
MSGRNANPSGRPQVVVRVCSGLGNQLFQYACGLALARRLQAELRLDTSWFQLVARLHRPLRTLKLPSLGLEAPEAFAPPRRQAVGLAVAAYDRWRRGGGLVESMGGMKLVQEGACMRRRSWEDAAGHLRLYLNGYWQTADHFLDAGEEIRRSLCLGKRPVSAGAAALLSSIRERPTAFVHVRRGDYTRLMGESGLLSGGYYRRAAEMLLAQKAGLSWLVFAEDAQWARENLGFLGDWVLADYVSPDRDIEDLVLMAACDAGIIANSSYSWWGAALGDRPGRAVVAPATYWNRPGTGLEEWALPRWQRIPGWD